MKYPKRKLTKKQVPKAKFQKSVFKNRDSVVLGKGFPKQMVSTHKYTNIITLASTAGSISSFLWSANSMYRPDYTGGTSSQPLFFDQFSAIYDHYTVIASKATFKFMPANSSNNVPITCLVMLNDYTSIITTTPYLNAQQTGSTIKFLQMDAGSSLTINKGFSAKKTYGPNPLANNKLAGTGVTSPSEQTFYQILTQPTDAAATQSVIVYVSIEYVAIWHELIDIATS